jgi:hypothetical protein
VGVFLCVDLNVVWWPEQDLTQWTGERGRTYFYQSELPYVVSQAEFGDPAYAGCPSPCRPSPCWPCLPV